jgi:DNA-binding Lrp family transcriptional regulator
MTSSLGGIDYNSGLTTRPAKRARSEMTKVDDVDWKIIQLLLKDARVTNRAIAKEVGITEATAATRLEKLLKRNVIKIIPVYDWKAAGYTEDALIYVQVAKRSPAEVATILASFPGVLTVGISFGSSDLIVVLALTQPEFYQTVSRIEAVEGVADLQVERIQNVLAFVAFWVRLPPKLTRPASLPAPAIVLDAIDRNILSRLQSEGRISSREIARKLDVHDAKIRSRIRRMEESGLLGLRTVVDPTRTGRETDPGYVVGITATGNPEGIANRLKDIPEALYVAVTQGRHNVTAIIQGPSARELNHLLDTVLWSTGEIRSIRVFVIADFIKVVPDLWRLP